MTRWDGAIAAVVCTVAFLHLVQFRASPDVRGIADEGYLLDVLQRTYYGELIYQEFFWAQTPLSHMILLYIIYPVFGMTLNVARVFTSIQGGFLAALTYLLSRSVISNPLLALYPPLLFIFFGFHNWNNVSHHWFCLSFILPGLMVFPKYSRHPLRSRLLFLSGILGGLGFLCLQTDGLVFLAVGVIFLLLRNLREKTPWVKDAVIFSSGAVAVVMAFLIIFIFAAKAFHGYTSFLSLMRAAIYDCFIWPMTFYARFNALPHYFYFGNQIIKEYALSLLSPSSLKEFLVSFFGIPVAVFLGYAPFPALIASGLYLIKRKKNGGHLDTILLYSIFTLFSLLSAIKTRPDPLRIIYFSPITFALVFYFLEKGLSSTCSFLGQFLKAVVGAVLIVLGIAIIAWGASWAYSLSQYPGFEVKFPRGRLIFPHRAKAAEFSALLHYVNRHTKDGEYMYVHGWSPQYYFLLNRRNPTSYNFLIPVHFSLFHIRRAVSQMEEKRPRYVLYDGKIEAFMQDPSGGTFPALTRDDLKDNPMVTYIHSHYHSVVEFPSLGLSLLSRASPE